MTCHHLPVVARATILTLGLSVFLSVFLSGCTANSGTGNTLLMPGQADAHSGVECKSRAYIHSPLSAYLTARYLPQSPVRLGIIPFSTPANISTRGMEAPGLGDTLAQLLQAELVSTGEVPIVEILYRQDWPGKKEEFFTGNFGAIQAASDAGYDLVVVGFLQRPTSLDSLQSFLKIIDVNTRTTVYYGESLVTSSARTDRPLFDRWGWNFHQRRPDRLPTESLSRHLSRCLARHVLADTDL